MDSQIASVLAALKQEGLYKNTLIVFVADHGENFLSRGPALAFNHSGLFEDVVHLPLVMKFAEERWRGSATDVLVGNLDIGPTILDQLDVRPPDEWEGQSFLGALEPSRVAPNRESLIIEGAHGHEVSIRTREWMYREVAKEYRQRPEILAYLGYQSQQPQETYNLRADPKETQPLSAASNRVAEKLQGELLLFWVTKARTKTEALESKEHIKALRALGYVQ